jgi:formylglycine-generating enzyme required for sulfatase activity
VKTRKSKVSKISELRAMLDQYDDPQIDAFCIDHFPTVYDRFARGMQRIEKINLLLNHCRKRPNEFKKLRELLGDILTITWPIHLELVRVPPGEFLMGNNPAKIEDVYPDERPQHRIELPAYYIGKYPVTNAQYAAFGKATGHRTPEGWERDRAPNSQEDHPVWNVSWHDAVAFCEWLSQECGRQVRLPSEAEWEKAARGTDGHIYPWGDDAPTKDLCNFGNNVGGTTPVGQYSPQGDSPYGCADMAGNVREWTRSLYKSYPYDAYDGREDMEVDGARVIRGGTIDYNWNSVRAAVRFWHDPDYRVHYSGFRIVIYL